MIDITPDTTELVAAAITAAGFVFVVMVTLNGLARLLDRDRWE